MRAQLSSLSVIEQARRLWTNWARSMGGRGGDANLIAARRVHDLFVSLSEPQPPSSVLTLTRQALAAYSALGELDRLEVLKRLSGGLTVNTGQDGGADDASESDGKGPMTASAQARRQLLIRRLNSFPRATNTLIEMRADVLRHLDAHPELAKLNADLLHVFEYWFSAGFLTLERLEWSSPAHLLRKLIEYEAVHEIKGWDDLRGRLEPPDRRCYAFFHPGLPETPLIFVEVALTAATPCAIDEILADTRERIPAERATTAVFYSISNCQPGLRGIPFGNFLIKRVVEHLSEDLPRLRTFVTLSPVPKFARWLDSARSANPSPVEDLEAGLALLDQPGWPEQTELHSQLAPALRSAAARYFLEGREGDGPVIDPVARFHLGNGAQLEGIHFLADMSPTGLRQSHGIMVNYRYAIDEIERNYDAFHRSGRVVAGASVKRLARPASGTRRAPRTPLAAPWSRRARIAGAE